jgi:hypothetical protein
LVLPFAVGLAVTALAATDANVVVQLVVQLGGAYVIGRVLWDEPLGRLLAALVAAGLLAALIDHGEPWWWPLAQLPVGLVSAALPVSIGQLQGRRADGGPDAELVDLRARVGALVTLVSITLVAILVFMSVAGDQMDRRAHITDLQLELALADLDGTTLDRSDLSDWIAGEVDAALVRSTWDGEWLRLWFEVRIGLLPVRCVTGISGDAGWSTAVRTGPCR